MRKRRWNVPAPSECRKTVKTPTTGRKRVTRGTQEGFLSFSIGSFQNFFKGLKTCSGCRKHFFDSLAALECSSAVSVWFEHWRKVRRREIFRRSRRMFAGCRPAGKCSAERRKKVRRSGIFKRDLESASSGFAASFSASTKRPPAPPVPRDRPPARRSGPFPGRRAGCGE